MANEAVVDRIYEAALDLSAVEPLARALADHFGAVSAMITDVDGLGRATAVQWGHDATMNDAYASYYRERDVWVAAAPQCAPGAAISVDRLVDYETLSRTEFYNDFLRPNGGMAHCLGLWTPVDSGVGLVSIQRSRRQGAFDQADEAMLDSLAPHLVRAAQMRARLSRSQAKIATLSDLLDRAPEAVIVVRPDGRIDHLNRAGRSLIAAGVFSGSGGQTGAGAGAAGNNQVIAAILHRLRTTPLDTANIVLGSGRYQGAATRLENGRVLVSVIDVVERRARQVRAATDRFRLTPAEAALLAALLGGQRPQDFAASRDLRISTVRTQLSALLAKAGVDRQASLISLVSALPTVLSV